MFLTLPLLQGFSFRETAFHLCQFLSNFLKYSSSNLPSSHPYNIFAINFPGNSPLLKSLSSAFSIFSCFLISVLPSKSVNASSAFFELSFLSQVSPSAVNPFHRTRYFSTPLTFFLFKIFSTSHSSTPSTSIGFPSSFF